jgi:hypothetical protein
MKIFLLQILQRFYREQKYLFFGICAFVIYKIIFQLSPSEVHGVVRLFGYLVYLNLLICLYILLVKRKSVLLSNLILLLFLGLIFEVVCFFMLGMPPYFKKKFEIPDVEENHIVKNVGDVLYSDSIHSDIAFSGNDTIFDVHYSIDSFHKRITPEYNPNNKQHALFFGCSIAFGHGVEDNETMPYYFQKNTNKYNAYNFAYSGHGTNHMLARLQYEDLTTQVKEKKGLAFYTFFWDHMFRSIGTMNRYTSWLHNAPYYEMNAGQLERKKMFKNGRFWQSYFYESVYQSNIVKYFELDFPLKLKEEHIQLVVEMIAASKKEYQKQFPGNEFYVVIYPIWFNFEEKQMPIFLNRLKEKQIKYITLTEFRYEKAQTLGEDPHPNAQTHDTLSKLLYHKIKL